MPTQTDKNETDTHSQNLPSEHEANAALRPVIQQLEEDEKAKRQDRPGEVNGVKLSPLVLQQIREIATPLTTEEMKEADRQLSANGKLIQDPNGVSIGDQMVLTADEAIKARTKADAALDDGPDDGDDTPDESSLPKQRAKRMAHAVAKPVSFRERITEEQDKAADKEAGVGDSGL